ncbi:unnamed protein product, partial [marine sediment metagenome]
IGELNRLGWHTEDVNEVLNLAYSLPNPMLMIQGELLEGYSKEEIIEDVERADIHPKYANVYWDAVLTKPSTQDLVAYELRRDPSLNNLHNELTKVGVHPNYHPSFKGIFKTKDVNRYMVETVTKHLTREYTKGTVDNSGRVNPFVLV